MVMWIPVLLAAAVASGKSHYFLPLAKWAGEGAVSVLAFAVCLSFLVATWVLAQR